MEQSTAVWSDVADTAVLVCITPRQKEGTKQKLGRSEVLVHSLLKTGEQQNNDLLILSPPNKQFLKHTNLFSLSYNDDDDDEDDNDDSSSDSSSAPPRLSKLSLTSSDDDSIPHSSVNNKNDHSAASSFSSASSDDHHNRTKENETSPPCCRRLSGDSGHETQSSGSVTEEETYDDDDKSLVDIDLEESLRRRENAASESDKDLMHQISKALQQTIIPSTETAKQSLDQIGKTTKQSMNQLGKLFMSSPLQKIPKQSTLQNLFASPTSKKQAINYKLLDDLPTLSDDTDSMDNENNSEELEKEMNTNSSDEATPRPTMKEFGEQNEIPPDLSPQFVELQRTMERKNAANNNNQLGGSIRILDSILSFQLEIMDELPDFKPHFEMVLTELQRTATQQTASFFHQQGGCGGGDGGETEAEEEENSTAAADVPTHHHQQQQQEQEETAKVLANLVAAASADRAALVSLTQTVHRLAEQIEAKDKEIADLRSDLRTTTSSSNGSNILSCSERSNYDYIHEANLNNNKEGQKPITKPEECQKEISAVTI